MAKIIHIPKTKTFDLPCGLYKCQLDQTKCMARQTQRGRQDWIRLIFTVDVPGMDNVIACAGRNFVLDANVGSDLRNFLEQWLYTMSPKWPGIIGNRICNYTEPPPPRS